VATNGARRGWRGTVAQIRPGRTRLAVAAVAALAALAAGATALGSTAYGSPTAHTSALISKARCQRNTAAGTINFISPFGYDASAGIIDAFMAQKLGYFKDLCLNVAFNASSFTSEQLVSSGQGQVTGIGSAADAILSAASGANITTVATYGNTDPHVIYAQASITNLKQLDGGTLGYHTNMSPAIVAMLTKAGVNVSSIHLISLTSYDPTVVTRGQIDAATGFASNEPLQLKAAGMPFHEYLPSQFGVKGTYNVMQFNTDFLHAHRAVVADFMRADLKALDYCLVHKVACVKYMADLATAANQGQAFPYDRELSTWNWESQYIVHDHIGGHGVQTAAEWKSEWQEVKKYGTLCGLTASDVVPPISKVMDPTLVAGLYKGTKLIWPGK
jgi:NitT/TauT family transport system substrate-binding protein